MSDSNLALIFAIIAATGFAGAAILIRIGVEHVSVATANFYTVLVGAALVLGATLVINWPEVKALPPVAFAWFALMGAMAYPVARLVSNKAISLIGAARSTPMSALQPVFALALGISLLGERPNMLVSLGTSLVVAGLLLVFLTAGNNRTVNRAMNVKNLGYFLAVAGAAIFATRDVISRHVLTGISPPLVAAGFALLIGGAMLLVIIHRQVLNSTRDLPPNTSPSAVSPGYFKE